MGQKLTEQREKNKQQHFEAEECLQQFEQEMKPEEDYYEQD